MNILIFGGTTEGRLISSALSANKIAHTVSVATEYGKDLLSFDGYRKVLTGRLDEKEMTELLRESAVDICIDATHPFAENVTENIKGACSTSHAEYIRVLRENPKGDDCRYFDSHSDAVEALLATEGNILLTVGSKNISEYAKYPSLLERLYVRVLPAKESLDICMDSGIPASHIIAMQGPFSTELNTVIIRDLDIKVLVTKESGEAGGFKKKLAACKAMGVEAFAIGRPMENEGVSLSDILNRLGIGKEVKRRINIIGAGMGDKSCLTLEAEKLIRDSDVIIGAESVISGFNAPIKVPLYKSSEIIEYIKKTDQGHRISVLFSGDTGFFSGAKTFINDLKEYDWDIEIFPGISSVSYFSSRIGKEYDNAKIISIHGRKDMGWQEKVRKAILENEKTFILLSGDEDLMEIEPLIPKGCKAIVGCNLSKKDEEIRELKSLLRDTKKGSYILFVENPEPSQESLPGFMEDSLFTREKVPMTKAEVRALSIAKLNLSPGAVVYDIGSGSGSVSVQIAKTSSDIQVYAIEKKPEAFALTKKNIEKFDLFNVSAIEGKAPDMLTDLPAPTHVFIGGSGGNLIPILKEIYKKNSNCTVVITAVTLETLEEIRSIEKEIKILYYNLIQLSVSRVKKNGAYNMINSENPVWICDLRFSDGL